MAPKVMKKPSSKTLMKKPSGSLKNLHLTMGTKEGIGLFPPGFDWLIENNKKATAEAAQSACQHDWKFRRTHRGGSSEFFDECTKCGHRINVCCFEGSGLVELLSGSCRVDMLKKGDQVKTPTGYAEVVCVVQTQCAGGKACLAKVATCDGLALTPNHPVWVEGAWRLAADLGPVSLHSCDFVYNFVLSSGHALSVNGVTCLTLGHGVQEEIVAHPYYGTEKVLKDLSRLAGWEDGLVRVVEGGCLCGEVGRVAGELRLDQYLVRIGPSLGQCQISFDQQLLLSIHAVAMGGTDVPSSFRSSMVHLTGQTHTPPPASEIPRMVQRFCDETNAMLANKDNDPYSVGAFCLWWVNAVHPFQDGNGRTARGLAYMAIASLLGPRSEHLSPSGFQSAFGMMHIRKMYLDGLVLGNRSCGICACCGDPCRQKTYEEEGLVGLANLLHETLKRVDHEPTQDTSRVAASISSRVEAVA